MFKQIIKEFCSRDKDLVKELCLYGTRWAAVQDIYARKCLSVEDVDHTVKILKGLDLLEVSDNKQAIRLTSKGLNWANQNRESLTINNIPVIDKGLRNYNV